MTVLLADVARDALLAYLRAQLPAQIAAVNAIRTAQTPAKHALPAIVTWTGSPLVATPEPPAVYVLPQTSGFRGTQLATTLDQQAEFFVYLQVGNQDEETAEQDLLGYAAALMNALLASITGAASLSSGCQVLFGHGGGASENVLLFGPNRKEETSLFYQDCYLALTVFFSENV